MSNNTETKLPFAEGDSLEFETEERIKTSVKILVISENTNTMFVVDENEFDFSFAISDVLDRINDGRFVVKEGS